MPNVIDCDQHLYEYRGLWADHIDPCDRDEAIRFEEDALGHVRVMWRARELSPADVQLPGETDAIGERRRREREGLAPLAHYDEILPRDYWEPTSRVATLDAMGVDQAMLFPNYGLSWERVLGQDSPPAMLANMAAWNRWCAAVQSDGRGRLHAVAHLSLRDLDWLDAQLAALERAGVRAAMIAPSLVDGRRLSHPDLDRAWASFVARGVTPVFHVADQPPIFGEGWYPERRDFAPAVLDSVFLYTGAAVAVTDLIIHGVFLRHPDLRIGIVELSAVWVPLYLMMLDGGASFVHRLNGRSPVELAKPPSEYFHQHVRVSSFAYELPVNICGQLRGANPLMACSDYPHSEGTGDPLGDYAHKGPKFSVTPAGDPALFGGNAAFLLRQ